MNKVTFQDELCKGCGLCANACPKKILAQTEKINAKGYTVYGCIDQAKCIACGFCHTMCPDCVITVEGE